MSRTHRDAVDSATEHVFFFTRMIRTLFRTIYYWRMRKYVRMAQRGTMTSDQEKCFGIIRNLAVKAESELTIAPISQKFYIRNGDIFVIVERGMVAIINGVYHYDIPASDLMNRKITAYLYRVIERRRAALESVVRSKIDRSLDNIYYETKNLKGPKKDAVSIEEHLTSRV